MKEHADITLADLSHIVRQWAGSDARLIGAAPLVGGCINITLLLTLEDTRRAVMKITPNRANPEFGIEAKQLARLKQAGVPAPAVYAVGQPDDGTPHSYLLMEYIEGITLCDAETHAGRHAFDALQIQLAQILASLHENTDEHYQTVGKPETQTTHWPQLYARIYDTTVVAVEGVPMIPIEVRRKLRRVHDSLDRLLRHSDRPRLMHGDLWGGNVLCREHAGGWTIAALIDPTLRFGHTEAELAYIELFDTCGRLFFDTYTQAHPIDSGYDSVRRPIYQLYPLMRHVELFGAKYVPQLLRVAEQIAGV